MERMGLGLRCGAVWPSALWLAGNAQCARVEGGGRVWGQYGAGNVAVWGSSMAGEGLRRLVSCNSS